MRYLITGGFGFIGSAIANALISKGNIVTIFDNHSKPLIYKNFINVVDNKFRMHLTLDKYHDDNFIRGDARDFEVCLNACKDIDTVIHCAAIHLANDINRDLRAVIDVNIKGTLNLLKASVKAKVSKFIYLSSAKVYGEPESIPSKELDFIFPMETYSLTKAVGEQYLNQFHDQFGLNTISLRPFSVYGPRQNLEAGYIGMIIKTILGIKVSNIPANPEFLRDFTYISDLVDVAIACAEATNIKNEVFNVGSGKAEKLKDIISLAEDIANHKIDLSFIRPKSTTIANTFADMSKVKEYFNISPKVSIKEGLQKTFIWFKDHYS